MPPKKYYFKDKSYFTKEKLREYLEQEGLWKDEYSKLDRYDLAEKTKEITNQSQIDPERFKKLGKAEVLTTEPAPAESQVSDLAGFELDEDTKKKEEAVKFLRSLIKGFNVRKELRISKKKLDKTMEAISEEMMKEIKKHRTTSFSDDSATAKEMYEDAAMAINKQQKKEAEQKPAKKSMLQKGKDMLLSVLKAGSKVKEPDEHQGAQPAVQPAPIVAQLPKNPEQDHKEEKQFKKITRKNVGKIDDGVKTDKKKLNTHVDATVNLSDIQKALNKQKDRMKLKPAKITYHRLGKPIATATRDTF